MAHIFSEPVDNLTQATIGYEVIAETDVLIVGSGYGASIAAMKLAGLHKPDNSPLDVLVLERGNEYAVGEFPNRLGDLPGHVRFRRPDDEHPTGNPDALFEIRAGGDVDILVGNGLGGGSLINANVVARPDPAVFNSWPAQYQNGGLDDAFDDVESLLGVGPTVATREKYDSLNVLAQALGTAAQKARVAVTHGPANGSTINAVNIDQPNCTHCGNCVTGCNIGAKNTLMMNLIPLAHERGARFVTGANVLSVTASPGARRWRVRLQRTVSIRTPLEAEMFFVDADHVILAAGAVGSTEILLRSRSNGALVTSNEVGKRFSTNGDGLGFSFGQTGAVNALGTPDINAANGPGPTITGIVQSQVETDQWGNYLRYTLEDGAVPGSIVKLFGELVTTGAELGRIGSNALPAWFAEQAELGRNFDPLAYNPELLHHSQVLLMMCDDGARRSLFLSGGDGPDHNAAFPTELAEGDAYDAANAGLSALDRALSAQSLAEGFEHGQYVANPLWKLLPESASSVLSGKLPKGRNLTVHPLGGCAMGADVDHGVVNPDGVVFDPNGDLHAGLYVMDGAVIPGALAINPLLTISAVAWSCCDALIAAETWTTPNDRPDVVGAMPAGLIVPLDDSGAAESRLTLREQMLGKLDDEDLHDDDRALLEAAFPTPVGMQAAPHRFTEFHGMVLRIRLDPFDVHADFAEMPEDGIEIDAEVDLYLNPEAAAVAERRQAYGAPTWLADEHIVASGTARVTILQLDYDPDKEASRGRKAKRAYFKRRQGFWSAFFDAVGNWLSGEGGSLGDFTRVAEMHARYRQFRYRFDLTHLVTGATMVFAGRKKVRWQRGERQLWDSLLALPVDKVTISFGGQTLEAPALFSVDAGYMLDEGLIQIADVDGAEDLTESAVSTFSFLGWFARCLLQTSFWEFGAPAYPKNEDDREQALDVPELQVGSGIAPELIALPVPTPEGNELPLELHRYRRDGQPPVLLVHGLAQGSGIFTSPHMDNNMASYFYKQNYDVWVVDYRLSNRFDNDTVPYGDWSIDVIGQVDVPAAVKQVYDTTGRAVRVFAHCVGAIGMQMAILSGNLKQGGVNMVHSVCFNAIHPWILPSAANLARGKLGAFTRAWVSDELLNPILETEAALSATQSLFDRLGFSFAQISQGKFGTDEGHGRGEKMYQGICDRMTALYSRMWRHKNIEGSLREGWIDIVGRAPPEVYQQLYFLIRSERILNDDGQNEYLTDPNLRANWREIPTFFLHGDVSDVFNPQSATCSANRLQIALQAFDAKDGGQSAPVYLHRVPGYGHMDPILARKAHTDVYPKIHAFFGHAETWHTTGNAVPTTWDPIRREDDPDWPAIIVPETGHVLRAAWIDGTEIAMRYWIEKFRMNTAVTDGTSALGMSPPQVITLGDPVEDWYEWLDVRTIDGVYVEPTITSTVEADGSVVHILAPNGLMETAHFPDLLAKLRTLISRGLEAGTMGLGGGVRDGGGVAIALEDLGFDLNSDVIPFDVDNPPPWFRRLEDKRNGMTNTFRFLLGSCRYPGMPIERDLSDSVFEGMLRRIENDELDMAVFLGDQIYADAYSDVFDDSVWRERYYGAYRGAFQSPAMKRVLKALPIHFAMDDHEIVDNWSGGSAEEVTPRVRGRGGPVSMLYGLINDDQVTFAHNAARSYMSSAREQVVVGGAAQPPAGTMWYALDHDLEVNFPCFVLDTRSERETRTIDLHGAPAQYPPMMNAGVGQQLEAFLAWLDEAKNDHPHRPKFVFAGQILAPVTNDLRDHPTKFRHEDGFFGYPGTLRAIIEHIVNKDIRNVVFVGGDLHMSCAAHLHLTAGGSTVDAWQIVASGLYAPLPFANAKPSHYTWLRDDLAAQTPTLMPDGGVGLSYHAEWLTDVRRHFLRVEVTETMPDFWAISVSAYDRDGIQLAAPAFNRAADHTRLQFV